VLAGLHVRDDPVDRVVVLVGERGERVRYLGLDGADHLFDGGDGLNGLARGSFEFVHRQHGPDVWPQRCLVDDDIEGLVDVINAFRAGTDDFPERNINAAAFGSWRR